MSRILKAEEKHIPELLRLLVQVNMVHHEGRPDLFKGPTTKYDADGLKKLLASPDHRLFVCEDDICVDEAVRRRHVGQALFGRVREEAAALDCGRVTLNVWELNAGARRFYESLGMLPLKTTMELRLSAER